jgi:protein SCO1/2
MKALRTIIPVLLLLTACHRPVNNNRLPYYNTPDFTPVWLTPDDDAYKSIHTIPTFNLTNQLGQVITNKSTAGKIYVANFFFTSCRNICPPMMDNLAKVSEAYAGDNNVLILSHSVTPTRDNVDILAKYAATHHINGKNWWLLTGNQPAIYKLARQAYFADDETGYNKGTDQFLHTENLVLIDQKGRIRGVYNGSLIVEIETLIANIKQLEKEK